MERGNSDLAPPYAINDELYTPTPELYTEPQKVAEVMHRDRWLKRYRIGKTFAMVFIWFCMGCYNTMNQTTIDDLRELIGVDYERFSRAFVTRSVGMLIGSFCMGPLADIFPGKIDLMLAVSMTIMSGGALVLPLCPNLYLMALSFCLQGAGQAALSASGNAHVMSMWGEHNSSPVLCLHFGFAAGNVLGPVLAGPFLADLPNNGNDTEGLVYSMDKSYSKLYSVMSESVLEGNSSYNNDVVNSPPLSWNTNHNETQVWIPYVASGSLGLAVAVVFFIFFFLGLPEEFSGSHNNSSQESGARTTFRSSLSPGNCTGGKICYGVAFFTLLIMFYITNVGKDAAFFTFTLPIAIDPRLPLHFTKKSADLLIIIIATCGAFGRFTFAFLAKFLSMPVIVFIQITFIVAAQILLLVRGLDLVVFFWVGSCVFSFFSSPLFPSVLAWADKYVKMTAVAVALVDVATGSGAFIFAWLSGYVFQYKQQGALWVLGLSSGCGIAMGVFMIMLQILASCHGNRFERIELDVHDNEDDVEPLLA